VPVLQLCVYVTFPVAKYVPTGDGLADALSSLGDVLAVFQIPAGFCVEFSTFATARAVLQSFRANGPVVSAVRGACAAFPPAAVGFRGPYRRILLFGPFVDREGSASDSGSSIP
jgi:hypothetical protein